jgi:2'-5' RNA ligase
VRLFVAIAIPDEIRERYAALIRGFRAIAPQVKWVWPENLHITLKFLGQTPPEKLDALRQVLTEVCSPDPVKLNFLGLGFFPNQRRPRVLWAGMEASANLKLLAAGVDQAAHRSEFPLEERRFTPHLTLARFDPPAIAAKLLEAIRAKSAENFGALTATEFHLIESKLKPSGAEYTTVQTFRFAPEG